MVLHQDRKNLDFGGQYLNFPFLFFICLKTYTHISFGFRNLGAKGKKQKKNRVVKKKKRSNFTILYCELRSQVSSVHSKTNPVLGFLKYWFR